MKSLINLFKTSLNFPVIWVGIIYLFGFMSAPIPIDEYFSHGIRLLGIYFVITALEKSFSGNKILSIILLIFLLPVALVTGLLLLDLMSETVGWLGREIIYIPLILLFSGYAAYKLYQRPANDNKTLRTLLFIAILPVLSVNFARSIALFPKVIDQKDAGSYRYYIIWEIDSVDIRDHLSFYKCRKWSIKCDHPYHSYTRMFFDKIVIDEEKNEVSAVDGDFEVGLAFTYGENSREYDGYPVQLGNQIYQLSINYDYGSCEAIGCGDYTYTTYECNLDYTSCDPLPIQYLATSDRWVYLDINEMRSEINAYDRDDNLIFTYGENPACYMDGCVILDQ